MKTTDVLVWLHGKPQPVRAGEFKWEPNRGEFTYSPEYLATLGRFALDPIKLPLTRSVTKELKNNGVFGVFRDSGPDSWGKDLLVKHYGDLDDFDYLVMSGCDGVGAVSLGDITKYKETRHYSLSDLDDASVIMLKGLQKVGEVNEDIRLALKPTTSLGGAKPKMTVVHDEELWIAKFPERSDSPYLAHNEHVMLELATMVGINASRSFVHTLPDGRHILLIKRFDRQKVEGGYARTPYVSANTVLGITGVTAEDMLKKSYLRLYDTAGRWVGSQREKFSKDLFDRILFNAMVSNVDDHARNHGFIYDHAKRFWAMSPAFDVLAFPSPENSNIALSMQFHSNGSVVSKEALISCGAKFGLAPEYIHDRLKTIAEKISSNWKPLLEYAGAPQEYIDRLSPAFRIANQVNAEPSEESNAERPKVKP